MDEFTEMLFSDVPCVKCGSLIPLDRMEALPYTRTCTKCSNEGLRHDPNVVCAKASPSGQNGWSPKD